MRKIEKLKNLKNVNNTTDAIIIIDNETGAVVNNNTTDAIDIDNTPRLFGISIRVADAIAIEEKNKKISNQIDNINKTIDNMSDIIREQEVCIDNKGIKLPAVAMRASKA